MRGPARVSPTPGPSARTRPDPARIAAGPCVRQDPVPVEAAAPRSESPSQVSRDYDGAEAMYKRALDHVTPRPPLPAPRGDGLAEARHRRRRKDAPH